MALQVTYEIVNAEEVAKDFARIAGEITYNTERLLDETALRAEQMLRSRAPKHRGYLAGSIDTFLKREGERQIGPTEKGHPGLLKYSPGHYGRYVEEGGGPTSTMPNVQDLMARLGIESLGEAIAIAKHLQRSGKAVRSPSLFVESTTKDIASLFQALGIKYIDIILK